MQKEMLIGTPWTNTLSRSHSSNQIRNGCESVEYNRSSILRFMGYWRASPIYKKNITLDVSNINTSIIKIIVTNYQNQYKL